MSFNLLVVDDEAEIVEWMIRMIREENIPDLEVCRAYSAKEALSILSSVKTDIVMTDIKMPGMSGLELLAKIKESWPFCKVIFLTGYMEFDYVYTAIQSQGVRYLLKNEKDKKILEAIRDALDEIRKELHDEEIAVKVRKQLEETASLMQREFLHDLVSGLCEPEHLTQLRLDELSLPLRASLPCMMVMGRFDTPPTDRSIVTLNRFFYSVQLLATKFLPASCMAVSVTDRDSGIIWIVQPRPENGDDEGRLPDETYDKLFVSLKGSLEYIQASVKNSLGMTISFVLSSKPFPLSDTPDVCNMLKVRMGYHIGLAKEILLDDGNQDISSDGRKEAAVLTAMKQLTKLPVLESFIETGRAEECFALLRTILEWLKDVTSWNYPPALEIYYGVSLTFLKIINRWNLIPKASSRIDLHELVRHDEHGTWADTVEYLYDVAQFIFDIQTSEEAQKASDAVARVKQYISTHIGQDLSLIRLADLVHVNPSYLSRLFKNVTGENTTDFISDMRILRAKELLSQNSRKINEISAEVGYDSPHSFARFFRNIVGVSPQEYRDAMLKSQ